jgi:hypothetical protein
MDAPRPRAAARLPDARPSRTFRPAPAAPLDTGGPSTPGPRALLAALVLYVAAALLATAPYSFRLTTHVPNGGDPAQHLWIMRWYRACLREGRSPFFCAEIQYPHGAPLGLFSPLHMQALLYLPIALVTDNDALAYNLIWLTGLATTGLGMAVLAWQVTRDRASAWLAGLLLVLSGPLMLHALGHLELLFLGAVPVFLGAWVRFVDAPTRRRLIGAVALYVLVAACAGYYMLFSAIPAAFYVLWGAVAACRRGEGRPWLRARAGWLAGFAALAGVALLPLFASHLWAAAHHVHVTRTRWEFSTYRAPWWGYVAPTALHRLGRMLPVDLYATFAGYTGRQAALVVEGASYLGVVTLGLVGYALACRLRFARAPFWWAVFVLSALLALGAFVEVGGKKVAMPALWLWQYLPMFKLVRCPSRFNVFAAIAAVLVAAVAARHLRERLRGHRWQRAAIVPALALVALVDLGLAPAGWECQPPPAVYTAIQRLDPAATVLELPLENSARDATPLDRTYWQSIHRLRTSAGYSGLVNVPFQLDVVRGHPFAADAPDAFAQPEAMTLGVVGPAAFRDLAWLFLAAHDYRYVLRHHPGGDALGDPGAVARLSALLEDVKIYEDADATVYARDRLPPPAHPVALPTDGWLTWLHPTPGRTPPHATRRVATVAAYNPDAARPLRLTLTARALVRARTVRLRADGRTLAEWRIDPVSMHDYISPPFLLPEGLHRLILESDGEAAPPHGQAIDEEKTPYSLRVERLGLAWAVEGGP